MRKRLGYFTVAFLLVQLMLIACGDSTATTGPTTAPAATTQAATTPAATTTRAATTAPATTVATTTSAAATTQAATTAPVSTAANPATTAVTQNVTPAAAQFPVTVKDGSGTSVTLTKKPDRIICLSPDCVSILFQLGLEPVALPDYLFGFGDPVLTEAKYFGAKSSKFTKISGAPGVPDAEQIASLKPDLIVADNTSDALATYRGLAPTFATAFKDITQCIETLRGMGQLTGRSVQAEAAIKQFQDRLNTYAAKSPKNKKVLYIQIYQVSFVPFDGSSTGQVLKQITQFPWHLDNDTTAVGWAPLSLEKILEVDPDVIFVGTFVGSTITPQNQTLFSESKQKLTSSPLWKEISAVKNNQIYEVNSYPWAGIGLLSLLQIMDDAATKLYPEIFPKPLP